MISKAKILRAKAKATLGNKCFKGGWLWPILVSLIASTLAGTFSFISFLTFSVFGTAICAYYMALVRRTAEAKQIGVYFNELIKGIGGKIILGLLQNLYILLWTIIPVVGPVISLVKSYSYAMAHYIKIDHPEYTANQCITASRVMMNGYKWKFFCLQLSFLGWDILTILTFGIIGYWVVPYKQAAYAEFYEELKAIKA